MNRKSTEASKENGIKTEQKGGSNWLKKQLVEKGGNHGMPLQGEGEDATRKLKSGSPGQQVTQCPVQ